VLRNEPQARPVSLGIETLEEMTGRSLLEPAPERPHLTPS
jgi:hypothetical protein